MLGFRVGGLRVIGLAEKSNVGFPKPAILSGLIVGPFRRVDADDVVWAQRLLGLCFP